MGVLFGVERGQGLFVEHMVEDDDDWERFIKGQVLPFRSDQADTPVTLIVS